MFSAVEGSDYCLQKLGKMSPLTRVVCATSRRLRFWLRQREPELTFLIINFVLTRIKIYCRVIPLTRDAQREFVQKHGKRRSHLHKTFYNNYEIFNLWPGFHSRFINDFSLGLNKYNEFGIFLCQRRNSHIFLALNCCI